MIIYLLVYPQSMDIVTISKHGILSFLAFHGAGELCMAHFNKPNPRDTPINIPLLNPTFDLMIKLPNSAISPQPSLLSGCKKFQMRAFILECRNWHLGNSERIGPWRNFFQHSCCDMRQQGRHGVALSLDY